MSSSSALGDQAADDMLAACARSGDCGGDHATRVIIIVMVTWAVVMIVFGVGVWILTHKSCYRPNEWPMDRWRRKQEERRRREAEGRKTWWERACHGTRRCLSRVKVVLWTKKKDANPVVKDEAKLRDDKVLEAAEKIEKEGSIGTEKTIVPMISP